MSNSVSVVIPTYNRPEMLREAIQSVMDQTRPASEVIIVDNGSFDATASVVREFGDRVVYERVATRGPSPSRNRGVELSLSRYVAFLDDDDLWHPQKLSIQMDFFDQYPDYGMISSGIVPYGGKIEIRKSKWRHGDLFCRLFMKSFIMTSSVIVNKSVFNLVGGFNVNYVRAEDYDLWLRIAEKSRIAHFHAPLIWYRKSPQRLSDDKIDLRKTALHILNERYDPQRISKRKFRRRISDVLIYLGREQVKAGHISEGRRQFIEALKLTPMRPRPIRYLIGSAFK